MALVSVNGSIYKPEDAKISVYDRGFLFGDAIYEVFRSYGKILFTLEQHLDRLYRSANAIQLDIGYTPNELVEQIYDFYKKENIEDVYIRLQISRGNCAKEQINLSPNNTGKANIVMYLHDLKLPSPQTYEKGMSLYCTHIRRNTKLSMDPNIKSGNYLNNIIALLPKDSSKYHDTFFLDHEEYVTEGTTFNIFMVKNGVVQTCPNQSDILQGITRDIVFHCADKANIDIKQDKFRLKALYNADEVFITSSTKEIMPVTKIDQEVIGSGRPGAITKKLIQQYKDFVQQYLANAKSQHPWRVDV
tara:strand:+ start:4743 stop:5651 length:909 start_codon:yes stop_codon:yes gene_type:complete